MKSLNQISFIDSSGNEIELNANNTKRAAFDQTEGTVPLRDDSGRFRVGNTADSSADGYIVINKNYVDGRISTVNQAISAEVTARQNAINNAINALDKSDTAATGKFVSEVSEKNGIISVSRRSIVDGDGVVLKANINQIIFGTKVFWGLQCSVTPSTELDVVRKRELDAVNTRLDNLGFNTGNATNLNNVSSVTLKKLGKFVVCKFKPTSNANISFTLPEGFRPYSNIEAYSGMQGRDASTGRTDTYGFIKYIISTDGSVTGSGNIEPSMAITRSDCIVGWSIDSNYPI